MDPSQRDVPQEGEVWLVLGWHQVELDALPELDQDRMMEMNVWIDFVYKYVCDFVIHWHEIENETLC